MLLFDKDFKHVVDGKSIECDWWWFRVDITIDHKSRWNLDMFEVTPTSSRFIGQWKNVEEPLDAKKLLEVLPAMLKEADSSCLEQKLRESELEFEYYTPIASKNDDARKIDNNGDYVEVWCKNELTSDGGLLAFESTLDLSQEENKRLAIKGLKQDLKKETNQ